MIRVLRGIDYDTLVHIIQSEILKFSSFNRKLGLCQGHSRPLWVLTGWLTKRPF